MFFLIKTESEKMCNLVSEVSSFVESTKKYLFIFKDILQFEDEVMKKKSLF